MCDQIKFSFEPSSCEVKPSVSPSPIGPSCLRNSDRKKGGITRNVSFPDDESQIVTGILEPENPWRSVTDVTNEDLISMYLSSCKKHGTYPITIVLDQLSRFELKIERNKLFSLQGVILNPKICETLEEILKHIQFFQINLESTALDDEASVALFDMLEYYESAIHLNISSNHKIGVRGWQACARMIKKTCCLEELEARNTRLNEVSMPILGRALKVGSQLQVLKLENCHLSGRPLIILASALKVNSNLKELYISENNLGVSDALQLGSMLKCNNTLQLLDVSHNEIRDEGFNYIIGGIVEQQCGLTVLMAWNNLLSRNVADTVVRLLEEQTSLETLNVGQNSLTDEFVRTIREPLTLNKNMLRLGLQSTSLSNEAAFLLADILKSNNLIQRVDLRDNNIQISGLTSLLECFIHNKSVIRLDLDKVPRKGSFAENTVIKYKSLVEQIREKCTENERNMMERKVEVDEDSAVEEEDSIQELKVKSRGLRLSVDTRKISLTCESPQFQQLDVSNHFLGEPRKNGRLRSPAPSPIPSPVSSPSPVRNRFQVSKVVEGQNSCPANVPTTNKTSSRFKVVTVVEPKTEPPPNVTKNAAEEPKYTAPNEIDDNVKTASEDVVKNDDKSGLKKEGSNPITERIRKLSWVSPILQAPAVAMESAKIPANLEKLIGLFQNPFVRNQTKSNVEESRLLSDINDNESNKCSQPVCRKYDDSTSVRNDVSIAECRSGEDGSDTDFGQLSEHFIKKLSEEIKCKEETSNSGVEIKVTEVESKPFPATWPQKLSSSCLSSPSKSSPNILEATAFVLLQGHVSSDLAAFQSMPVTQSENTAAAGHQT